MIEYDGPGEGWREVPARQARYPYVSAFTAEGLGRYWVREEPVPPLPTEEDTLIRVTWKRTKHKSRFALDRQGVWQPVGMTTPYLTVELRKRITGFEVLARPVGKVLAEDEDAYYDSDDLAQARTDTRRETVAEVLDWVKRDVDLGMAGGVLRERLARAAEHFKIR